MWELPIFIPNSCPKECNEQILNSLVSMEECGGGSIFLKVTLVGLQTRIPYLASSLLHAIASLSNFQHFTSECSSYLTNADTLRSKSDLIAFKTFCFALSEKIVCIFGKCM